MPKCRVHERKWVIGYSLRINSPFRSGKFYLLLSFFFLLRGYLDIVTYGLDSRKTCDRRPKGKQYMDKTDFDSEMNNNDIPDLL